MTSKFSEQELLEQLHEFFRNHNNEHMTSADATEFNKELDEIMGKATKAWGFQKTTDFVSKHALEFGKYDIEIDHLKMSDVAENSYNSWLFTSLNRRRKDLYKKSVEKLKENTGIPDNRSLGVRKMNGMYVSGPYLMEKGNK